MIQTTPPSDDALGRLPADVGLAVGTTAPDVVLCDDEDRPVRLYDFVGDGFVLLVFYRGGWCPYCNFQIQALTALHEEFELRGVTPVAVSVDRVSEAARVRARFTVPFPVLSDPDLEAHRAFRVLNPLADDEVAFLSGLGHDVERSSGRDHHTIAIPAVFLIDGAGVIRWAHADRDYKIRPSTTQILASIDTLGLMS